MAEARITLSEHLGMNTGKRVRYMHSIGLAIQNNWKNKARHILGDVSASTRTKYMHAIEVVDYNENQVIVRLSHKFAAMFEQGLGPNGVGSYGVFDMRKFLLDKPKGRSGWPKMGKKGKWRPIPFVRGKEQMAETVRKSSTDLAHDDAELEKRVRAVQGMKKEVLVKPFMQKEAGSWKVIRAGVIPKMIVGPRTVYSINPETSVRTAVTAQPHKTDLIAGTKKMGGKFVTFRIISYGGKPWYHPGIRPRRIARLVVRDIPKLLPDPRMLVK